MLDFPASPFYGDTYNAPNGRTYVYNNIGWELVNIPQTGNLIINDQTISGTNQNGDISIFPNGYGYVLVPNLKISYDYGNLISLNTSTIDIILPFNLDSIIDFSTTSTDFIPQNTYGTHNQINAPYAVMGLISDIFTNTELIIVGSGIDTDGLGLNAINLVNGEGTYSNVIIVDQTFEFGVINPPVIGAPVYVSRDFINPSFDILSGQDCNLTLRTLGVGDVVIEANVRPRITDNVNLGDSRYRWKNLYVGTGTVHISDSVNGGESVIKVQDGMMKISNSTQVEKTLDVINNINYNASFNDSGNTVQSTNKSTPVTSNGRSGRITLNPDTLLPNTGVVFTVNNDYVLTTNDVIVLNIQDPVTANTYLAQVSAVRVGEFDVTLFNYSGSNASDAVILNFAIINVS